MINWILRVGERENLIKKSNLWGINSPISANKKFFNNVKIDDHIWFIQKNKIIAKTIYISHDERAFGPIIYVSQAKEVRNITTEWISDKQDDSNCNELCELLMINFLER
jgi:hypothetical protein